MPEQLVWGKGRKEAFVEYFATDLQRALMDRSPLERKWARWLEQYRASVTTALKQHPWIGASNRTVPFTAMNADPLIARFVTTLDAPPNLWTLQPLNERWVSAAKPMQDFMQYLAQDTLHMYDVIYRAALEFVKLGTCITKSGWTFERRNALVYESNGQIVRQTQMLSQPFVDHVSLLDFVMPAEAYHIQPDQQGGAAWCAERIWLNLGQFLARAQGQEPFAPDYDPAAVQLVSKFLESYTSSQGSVEETRWKLDDNQPSHLRRIELWEGHCRFDATGTGTVDDIVVVFHLPSRTMLRATPQPYRHGKRPYEEARYFRGDGFYGIGECEQSEMFQETLSAVLNYQIDNVFAVNSPMIGVKLGANVVANEPIYPLKQWILDDPSKDIREIKLSDMYQSLPQLAQILQNWGERRTGINDIQLGNPAQLPARTPATSMLSLLQEGNRRFDLSLKDFRSMLDRTGQRTLQNLQQFLSNPIQNPGAMPTLQMIVQTLGAPEGGYVAQKLAIPLENIEAGLGVAITATSGSINKEVEKQSFMSLLQLQASMFMPMYLELAQILGNPQLQIMAPVVVQTAAQLFKGTSELQQRLYEQFDIRNTEDVLVNAAVLLDLAAQTAGETQQLAIAASGAALAAGAENGGSGTGPKKAGANR